MDLNAKIALVFGGLLLLIIFIFAEVRRDIRRAEKELRESEENVDEIIEQNAGIRKDMLQLKKLSDKKASLKHAENRLNEVIAEMLSKRKERVRVRSANGR